ncbi:hypothetical protein [Streptomyces noursei]|uniref:hypothetical protein n=1 Tax=Streptomyces noursei TaxID=1971 RepID=UPI000AD92BEB|nr:hypothetical protein [Streptomyces noursei]
MTGSGTPPASPPPTPPSGDGGQTGPSGHDPAPARRDQHRPPTPSLLDDLVDGVVPEAADPDRRRRNRKVLIRLSWTVLAALVALVATKGADWLTSEHDARVTSEADDKADHAGPAFSASVRLNTQYPEARIFDAPFSPQDKKILLAMQPKGDPLTPFYAAHHARAVSFTDVHHPAMKVASPGYSEEWLMDLLSDRKASLVITDLRIKGLTCAPAKAATVISVRGQAGGSYEGMLFDLARSPSTPLITGDEEQHYGEPFFKYKKIDLGNGAAPEGLRVQVTSGTQDCSWKAFETRYVDANGEHTQDITNNGKDFTVHGLSAHPQQAFEVRSYGPFVHECKILGGGRLGC